MENVKREISHQIEEVLVINTESKQLWHEITERKDENGEKFLLLIKTNSKELRNTAKIH